MEQIFAKLIAKATGIGERQVANTIGLLEEGCTIPFISRYRKEVTGTLDEVQVANISDNLDKLKELAKRKETILKTIEEQGKMTDELHNRIDNSWDSTELEDIYLPFKPKRKTRAEAARQKGLEPLATFLMMQNPHADIDKKVEVIIATMGSHHFYYTVQFAPIIFLKRLWIMHHLRSYRHAYRFIERFRGKPRFGR